jgi:hypothetical protein
MSDKPTNVNWGKLANYAETLDAAFRTAHADLKQILSPDKDFSPSAEAKLRLIAEATAEAVISDSDRSKRQIINPAVQACKELAREVSGSDRYMQALGAISAFHDTVRVRAYKVANVDMPSIPRH